MKWHFFSLETGLFTGSTFSGPAEADLHASTPAGCSSIAGPIDPQSQRIDLEILQQIETARARSQQAEVDVELIESLRTRLVIDYRPPAPSAEHVWNDERKRYQLSPEAADARRRKAEARQRIRFLELERQPRIHREKENEPGNPDVVRRWTELCAELDELRKVLASA
jgi:hypothetical protein